MPDTEREHYWGKVFDLILDEEGEVDPYFLCMMDWCAVPMFQDLKPEDFIYSWILGFARCLNIEKFYQISWKGCKNSTDLCCLPTKNSDFDFYWDELLVSDTIVTDPKLNFIYFSNFDNGFGLVATKKHLMPERYKMDHELAKRELFEDFYDTFYEGTFWAGTVAEYIVVNSFSKTLKIWKKYKGLIPN